MVIAATSLRKNCANRELKSQLQHKGVNNLFLATFYRTHGQEIEGLSQVFQGCCSRYFVRSNRVYTVSLSYFISYKIMDLNIILDNYTLHMIAEKQSISDNYNLFFCFAFHAYFSGRGGT